MPKHLRLACLLLTGVVATDGSAADPLPHFIWDAQWGFTINDLGQVAFTRNQNSLWVDTYRDGSTWVQVKLADTGTAPPGTPAGTKLQSLYQPFISNRGEVLLHGYLSVFTGDVMPVNDEGYWVVDGNGLRLAIRKGDPAPDAPLGTMFYYWSNTDIPNNLPAVFGDGGRFVTRIEVREGSTNNDNSGGIWAAQSGQLHMLARQGDSPAGLGQAMTMVVSPTGAVAFASYAIGGARAITALWTDRTGTLTAACRFGDPEPGVPGKPFLHFGDPDINGKNQLAFQSDDGIWSEGTGTLRAVALSGAQAPGYPLGLTFRLFHDPVLNDRGHVAFQAYTTGGGCAIWSDISGSLQPIVRTWDPVPGGDANLSWQSFSDPIMNGNDKVAFLATIGGTDLSYNPKGLFVWDANDGLRMLFRVGNTISVGPGDDRKISSIGDFSDFSGGSDGRPRLFNDLDQLVVSLSFEDNSFAAVVLTVPEPASILVLALGLGAILARHRRRSETREHGPALE